MSILTRLREAAPILSLTLALLFSLWMRHEAGTHPGLSSQQLEAIAGAMHEAPYRVGNWAGQNVPVPEAAGRMLRPNAILSRRYVNLDNGESIEVNIVHCSDARDMLGHFPPVCYPSNGWIFSDDATSFGRSRSGDRGRRVPLMLGEQVAAAMVYEFSRTRGWAEDVHIRVLNFFVLPDGVITHDINDVYQRTSWLGASTTGVAQVQVLTRRSLPEAQAIAAAGEVLNGLSGLFETLGVGGNGQSQ